MDEPQFQRLARRARLLTGDYGQGYGSGLRRHYYGESYGNKTEHEARRRRQDEIGRGYRDGLAGKEPEPLIGRPPLPPEAPRSDKKPRTIRLDDERWEKYRRLGTAWLEEKLDGEEDPAGGLAE